MSCVRCDETEKNKINKTCLLDMYDRYIPVGSYGGCEMIAVDGRNNTAARHDEKDQRGKNATMS